MAFLFVLLVASFAQGPWLPENVSTIGEKVDHLYRIIFILTTVMFFLTEGALLFFVFKYRARPGKRAYYFAEQNTLEIAWWIVPGCILLFLALYQWNTWAEAKLAEPKEGVLRVEVLAQQFTWSFRYPGPDGKFATPDDITTVNQLHVPQGVPVVAQMRSKDVIHSFYLPNFRIKQDVLPGATTRVWFQATKRGEFDLACAELCGLGHFLMGGKVIVLSREEFKAWLNQQAASGTQLPNWGWGWKEETS